MPMSAKVACIRPVFIVRAVRTSVRSAAHSGQRIPTEVGVMHSGQIGRPQREQETPVSRSGCR
jgi:hypothetical protein